MSRPGPRPPRPRSYTARAPAPPRGWLSWLLLRVGGREIVRRGRPRPPTAIVRPWPASAGRSAAGALWPSGTRGRVGWRGVRQATPPEYPKGDHTRADDLGNLDLVGPKEGHFDVETRSEADRDTRTLRPAIDQSFQDE